MTRDMTDAELAAPSARLEWRVAKVVGVRDETPSTRTLVLDVPGWPGHRSGQHVDVRLVAEDGYQAQRSYSIASPPENAHVELTVECIKDAEVSPYLHDVLQIGDGVEVRGPIGGYFVWDVHQRGPLLLVAGGSGIVPLMAMLRHRTHFDAAEQARSPVHLLYSARTADDIIYREELATMAKSADVSVFITLTRDAPVDWTGYRRRIDRTMLDEVAWPAAQNARAFVCGPTPLVEAAANLLVDIGYDAKRIRTERFGPTG
ncbi:MAG TPA: ferredoxin reductase [Gemmatimonadaceae bacterium]